MRFAEVAVDAPVGPTRTFSYSIPASIEVCPGQLVDVPFGPRTSQGIVLELASSPQVSETREILGPADSGTVLTESQLRLAQWTSDYYICSLFEAAALMLPPGGRVRQRTYVTAAPGDGARNGTSLTPYQGKVMEYVRQRKRVAEDRVVAALGQGATRALRRLEDAGLVSRAYGRTGHSARATFQEMVKLSDAAPDALDDLKRAPRQAALLDRLSLDGGRLVASDARKEYGASAVRALLAKGWLDVEVVPVNRDPLAGKVFPPSPAIELTPTQKAAAYEIRAAIATQTARTFLVEGVTGSGKTEIYLDAVRHCMELGKRAIVLVPEIALTHQTIERFASRFPGQVAVLHSGLSPGERHDQWWKIRRGEYGVVIGSRSAIFAPQADLGLIIIDEEHEWTYKQHDASPRYHVREVALKLAQLCGATVVLGSASPDLESSHRALRGEFRPLRLPQRVIRHSDQGAAKVNTGALASVVVVDMRRELREGHRDVFSRPLLKALGECLESQSQAILFLNRRGSASFMQCHSCGHGLKCRRCDIPMTFHRDVGRLLCHYCGDRRKPPSKCPQCQGYSLAYHGIGTKAVTEQVSRYFPSAKVIRWDRDSASRPADYERLLERFRSGEAQVLVGTQMIAKGLHFPSVTLVGVVSADVGLHVPDPRAGERTFQLLCQVAGRAGRGPRRGRVIIQTYEPDNYAIRAAARQDYQKFYREEIVHRREQGNPPFARLIRLLYVHANRALCEREALRVSAVLREQIESWGYSDVEVLGPTPAYPARLRGRYRWQIILRGPQPRTLLDKVPLPQGWVVDVDPIGLG